MLLIILLFHFLLLGYTNGQSNAGNCDIDLPKDKKYIQNLSLKDTDTNTLLLESSYSGELSDLMCTTHATDENVLSYFSVSAENSTLTIRTTDKLADIDKNTPKTLDSYIVLSVTCNMTCKDGISQLLLQFKVSDTNNYAPRFLKKEYTYEVASPIMPFSDFTNYGSKIIVEDLDFSNTDMTFTIVPDDFNITTIKGDGKQYTAQLMAKKIIQLTNQSLAYTITATDSGDTPKRLSTSQKIIIQSDSSKSLDSPSFKNTSYSFDYLVHGTTATLSPRDGPISLTTKKPESIASGLKLTGEFKDNFTPTFNPTDNTITLVATPVTSTASFIILTLSVETDAVATTSIVVYLPEESTPKFSSHVYTAIYTLKDRVKLDKPIEVTATRGIPEVTLSGDFKDHFELEYNESRKAYDFSVSEKINGSVKSRTQLLLTLTATFGDEKDESALIIELPEHEFEFTSTLYEATYDSDDTVTVVDENQPIAFSTAVDNIKITANGSYSEHFSIAYDGTLKNYYVRVVDPVPNYALPSLREIFLTLSAEDSYDFEAQAVVKISMPEAPEFSEILYHAEYPKEGTGLIDFERALDFTNVADPEKVTISLDSYQENFEVVYKTKEWYLKIKKGLDDSTLEKLPRIVITLKAIEKEFYLIGSTVLVLELPKARPEFSETLYTAEYPKEGTGVIEFQTPPNFKNVDDGEEISLTLSNYTQNFLVERFAYGEWRINIRKPLDNSTLKTNKELIITMEASGALFTKIGFSVLVLKLPEQDTDPKPPEFSNAHYLAEYPESGNGKISIEPKIEFSEVSDVLNITIEVSDYTSNFAIGYDTTEKLWQIQIENPLDESVLESESSLILTLTAKKKDVEGSGTATLVINLPSKTAEVAPLFSKSYYVAKYQYEASGDPSVVLVDDISITNKVDFSQISVVADDYSDNFDIKYNDNKWSVSVKSPLSDRISKERNDLVVSITATDKTNGMSSSSVIYLQLPVETEDAPKFSKTFYTAKYSVSDGKGVLTFDDPLEIVNGKNLDKITITTDNYNDNFKITHDAKTKKWVITVKTNLDDLILKSKVDIVLELRALDSTNDGLGTATLVVTLPQENMEEPPIFSSVFYQAEYNYKTTVLDTDIKIINKKDADKITVALDEGYEKYFNISLNKSTSIWHVTIIRDLPEWDTKDKEDLVLTLNATETDNSAVGKAALVLSLPKKSAILFSKAQYFADYIVKDGNASMTMEDIVITNRDSSSDIILGVGDWNFEKHFSYHISSKNNSYSRKIILKDPFSDEELGNNTEFILTLTAEDQEDRTLGTTTFIINLPPKTADDTALKFSQVHYEGAYVETEGTQKVNLDETIVITSKKSLDDLKLTIQNSDASKYFDLKKTAGNYEVAVSEPLPLSILQKEKSLILTLEADLAGTKTYATLVINLPKTVVDGEISFSGVLYNGRYQVTNGNVILSVDPIYVTTTATNEEVEVSISTDSPYRTYFAVSYADGEVTLESVIDLTEDILKQTPVIPLTLVVAIRGKPNRASAVLNVAVSYDGAGDTSTLAFNKFLYKGKYKDGIPSLDENISIDTDQTDDKIEVSVNNEYKDFFVAKYSNGRVTIAKGPSEVPAEKLKSLTNIPLLLLAKIKGTARSATAVINLEVANDAPIEKHTLAFAQLLYTGNYSIVNEKVQFQVTDNIEVNTDALESEINSDVTIDSEYAKYFKANYANKTVTIQALDPIPDDVLKTKAFIALKLTIKTTDSSVTSSAVLNIAISNIPDVDPTIAFSEVLYTGTYDVTGTFPTITYDNISLRTDETDEIIQVEISNGFKTYFTVKLSGKKVIVSLTSPISIDTIEHLTTIAITLKATIAGTSKSSSAVLSLRIKIDEEDKGGSILFAEVLHNGKYSVVDGKGTLAIDDRILVITDTEDSEIETSISDPSGYSSYFTLDYSGKTITVNVKENLPNVVLKDTSFIPLTITAKIKSNQKASSAVLNIKLENGKAAFDSFIYHGEYKTKDDKASLRHDPIKVVTDEEDDSVEVYIENEFATYFFMHYSNKIVTLELKNDVPSSTLQTLTNIPVELSIQIKGNQHSEFAVLNLKVIGDHDADTDVIAFQKVLYTGKYSVSDNDDKPKFTVDDIKVVTENLGDDIEITVWDDYNYNQYFNFSYSNNKVLVTLIKQLPANVYKNINYIPITLTAKIKSSKIAASTVLNIEIDYLDHHDDIKGNSVNTTGYVAAIVVLALVLIGLLAGAGGFYYFKIWNRRYAPMEDEDFGRKTFEKQARPSSKSLRPSSIEERRPTGYNFNPISEGDLRTLDTSRVPAENKERRKSVAFNENVQKLQLDPVNDDDIDKSLDDKSDITSL